MKRNATFRAALYAVLFLLISSNLSGQVQNPPVATPNPAPKKWYDSISLRGYAQVRYNRLLETNSKLSCEQCDRSWGENGGFFLRRMRLVFSGHLSERVYFYVQPDFATSASTASLHFGQLRDIYFDLGLDKENEFRVRIGQSKVPFGFDNLQSSQNRLSLDRSDALNSAVANERDLGVFFYWAPKAIRERFSMLVKDGYKGTGDYGVFSFGAYNGQTANKPELNDNKHLVARLSYPIQIGNQIIEPGIQAYTGKWEMAKDQLSSGVAYVEDLNYTDKRAAVSFVLFPKPFGIQAEYNVGEGPQFNKTTDSIEVKSLKGGYVTLSYMAKFGDQVIFPFFRAQYFQGGKKQERDARSYTVKEYELGIEWQPLKNFELVAMYTISDRRYEDFTLKDNQQTGSLLRLQAQLNF